jgi:hypothetical protein
MPPSGSARNIEFNLQEHVNQWAGQLKSELSITESDTEELKSHLLDLVDELKKTGLDDEEAFWVASKRMGNRQEWGAGYEEVNRPLIQMRRSLLILAGVLAYFLLYYFTSFSSKLLFIVLLWQHVDGFVALNWVSRYLSGMHFAIIIAAISMYFLEEKIIAFIENVKMKPKHTLYLLLTAIIFGITDTCLYPVAKNMMGQNFQLRSQLYRDFQYFDYSFPLVICVCFTILYFKYYKKTKF